LAVNILQQAVGEHYIEIICCDFYYLYQNL